MKVAQLSTVTDPAADSINLHKSTGSDFYTADETYKQYTVYERLYSLHTEKPK